MARHNYHTKDKSHAREYIMGAVANYLIVEKSLFSGKEYVRIILSDDVETYRCSSHHGVRDLLTEALDKAKIITLITKNVVIGCHVDNGGIYNVWMETV